MTNVVDLFQRSPTVGKFENPDWSVLNLASQWNNVLLLYFMYEKSEKKKCGWLSGLLRSYTKSVKNHWSILLYNKNDFYTIRCGLILFSFISLLN